MLTFNGVLKNNPYREKIFQSELTAFPLRNEHDYNAISQFKSSINKPVYVNYLQHYQLLEFVFNSVKTYFSSLDRIILKLCFPGAKSLPGVLLFNNVFIVGSIKKYLVNPPDGSYLLIDDSIKRNQMEFGNNHFDVYYIGKDEHKIEPSFIGFANHLENVSIFKR